MTIFVHRAMLFFFAYKFKVTSGLRGDFIFFDPGIPVCAQDILSIFGHYKVRILLFYTLPVLLSAPRITRVSEVDLFDVVCCLSRGRSSVMKALKKRVHIHITLFF